MRSASPRERLVSVSSGVPYTGCDPNVFVSPRTANGDKTSAIALAILSPTWMVTYPGGPPNEYIGLVPDAGGFSLTLYRAIMGGGGNYAKLKTLTGIAFNDQLVVGDISGGWGLRFSLGNAVGSGYVIMAVTELP